MKLMIVIVGLGNPGKKFENTRHNLGFRVVDKLAKENNFPPFKLEKKFYSLISRGFLNDKEIILVKPQTFMNDSGRAVKVIFSQLPFSFFPLWVVHDDLDILFGKIKISINKKAGGHKGVQSIIDHLKTKNFVRFRIGIGLPKKEKSILKESFVLEKFTKKERKTLKKVVEKATAAIKEAIREGIEKTMTEFNQ